MMSYPLGAVLRRQEPSERDERGSPESLLEVVAPPVDRLKGLRVAVRRVPVRTQFLQQRLDIYGRHNFETMVQLCLWIPGCGSCS